MSILAEAGITTRSLGIRRLLDPVALPRLTKFIRQGGYDIVHAHLEMAMTLAVPAAALARRPAVCTFHHVVVPLAGRAVWRERLAVEAATRSYRALFVSEASRRSFQEAYRPHGMPGNWAVLHNGIDLTNFTRARPTRRRAPSSAAARDQWWCCRAPFVSSRASRSPSGRAAGAAEVSRCRAVPGRRWCA